MADIPEWFVVCMGLGTVFVGLVCIIIICKIMSLFFANKKVQEETKIQPAVAAEPVTENRQEILAAVSAAVAEDMGTDVSAIRILSFKKI